MNSIADDDIRDRFGLPPRSSAVATLRWRQLQSDRLHAEHGDWRFEIHRVPNYSRYWPALVYDYQVTAQHGDTKHELGSFTDSHTAREKCAEFITQQQQGVSQP